MTAKINSHIGFEIVEKLVGRETLDPCEHISIDLKRGGSAGVDRLLADRRNILGYERGEIALLLRGYWCLHDRTGMFMAVL
ncbi:hypothetical protein D3C80_1858380 [compost metagenome]